MVLTPSAMIELGAAAPDFSLPNFNPDVMGETVSLADFSSAPALLVAFICNHCPYVIHIRDAFAEFAREYEEKGLAVVAINANDATRYPDDNPKNMTKHCVNYSYRFPYLFDDDQQTAIAYHATCTPDFFLFDENRELAYRGQFDRSRPGNNVVVTGVDLRAAADTVLQGKTPDSSQQASVGCSIKWKPGNEPGYV